MNKATKIILGLFLLALLFTNKKLCEHLGFGQARMHDGISEVDSITEEEDPSGNYFVDDSIYQWDGYVLDWVGVNEDDSYEAEFVHYVDDIKDTDAIEVSWELLTDIKYRLRYFKQIDMEMYAPVFNKKLKELDGKKVKIKGFVIPFEDQEGVVSLSANPFASCFFCGKASPASVMSMYFNDEVGLYKMDDYKTFKGILELNQDNPDEFYYILRDTEEVK